MAHYTVYNTAMIILHTNNTQIATKIAHQHKCDLQLKNRFFLLSNYQKQLSLDTIRSEYKVDINYYPKHFNFSKAKLLISDMDSTIIAIESIDEMAKYHGVGDEVVKITKSAMTGELDFTTSLKTRLALLKGLTTKDLATIYKNTLVFTKGAKTLINYLHQKNITTALASGGFDFFAQKIAKSLNITHYLANTLEINKGKLTGKVIGEVIGSPQKAQYLTHLCQTLNIPKSQTIAIGDGSNDLPMLQTAGLSVAYHAKPILKEKSDIIIDYGGLDTLCDFFD